MSDSFEYQCGRCGHHYSDFSEPCPACGTVNVFCSNDPDICDHIFPIDLETCPKCGYENECYELAPVSTPTPEAPRATPTSESTSEPTPEPTLDPTRDPEPASEPSLAPTLGQTPTAADPSSQSLDEASSPLLAAMASMAVNHANNVSQSQTAAPATPNLPEVPELPDLAAGLSASMTPNLQDLPGAMPDMTSALGMPDKMPTLGNSPGLSNMPQLSTLGHMSSSTAQVSLLCDTHGDLKVGEQAIVKIRLQGDQLMQPVNVRVTLQAGWECRPRQQPPVRLSPGAGHELQPIRLNPTRAGYDAVSIALDVQDLQGSPIEKSQGTIDLSIKAREQRRQGLSQVMQDIDEMMGGQLANQNQGWQHVELTLDPSVQDRLQACCPFNAISLPESVGQPIDLGLQASVHLPGMRGAEPITLVTLGPRAAFGRGGDPSVSWWIRPSPFDRTAWGRLSRRHCVISIERGKAWITDTSTNGIKLNQERIETNRPIMLADEDHIDLADVFPLRVKLVGSQDHGVLSVSLLRQDGLSSRVQYVLATPAWPFPATWQSGLQQQPTFMAFAQTEEKPNQPQAFMQAHDGSWKNFAPSEKDAEHDAYQSTWQPMPQPLDQQAIVSQ